MEGWFSQKWAVVLYSLLGFAGFICPAVTDNVAASTSSSRPTDTDRSSFRDDGFFYDATDDSDGHAGFLVLVSLVDGKFAALNVLKGGQLQWTVNTGPCPLVSASISNLQIKKSGGGKARLVPSLDGGLYQIDEEGIEPFPLNADTLLSSSYRFGEDSNLVGGKTTERYGINVDTGKKHYACSIDGCRIFDRGTDRQNGVLIIQRHTKTVRAIELLTGEEKWNFSVAEHSVSYILSASAVTPDTCQGDTVVTRETSDSKDKRQDTSDDQQTETCSYQHQEEEEKPIPTFQRSSEGDPSDDGDDLILKVIVPKGVVFAVRKNDPSTPVWKHMFDTPIANAWTLQGETLNAIDLFDKDNVPALSCEPDGETGDGNNVAPPLLYIGQHLNQPYVQPSVILLREMRRASARAAHEGSLLPLNMPYVHWMPYLATASSRTPAVTRHKNPLQVTWQPDKQHETPDRQPDDDADLPRSVAIWKEQYPYDYGFYLYPDFTPVFLNPSNDSAGGNNPPIKPVSLRTWWKEVLALSIVLAVVLHVSIEKLRKLYRRTKPPLESSEPIPQESETSTESKPAETAEKTNEKEFQSRFFTDFDPQACLGKGGFGVVFEARNKMDDCLYAIKRISLNNSERAKQKVMREVKALAKLEHTGIVRYYQSWFESPPPGWQEQHDQHYHDMFSTADYTTEPNLQSATRGHCARNPPCGFTDTSSSVAANTRSDTGFSVSVGVSTGSHYSEETDDSLLSESRDTTSSHNIAIKDVTDSFDIVFQDSQQKEDSDNHKKTEMSHTSDRLNVTDRQPCVSRCSGSGDASMSPPRRSSDTHDVTNKQSGEKETGAATKYVPRLLLYIQMQLCQRESLRDWLCANTLNRDRKQVLDMFDQILSAVDYVHECGLMHRDLKPSNIFFSLDGTVKVGDFGLVTASEEHVTEGDSDIWGDRAPSQTPHHHTNQVGTKLYMSPEQIAGDSYTHKVDIYALGMIFFELFYPFATEMERVTTLLNVKCLQFPGRFSRELPTECTFLEPLLSHKPDERPDTNDIRSHALLADFEEARVVVKRLRSISTSRLHTNSSSSGTSVDKDHS